MDNRENETYATNITSTKSPELIKKEQARIEFYSTYDVMTGVRIAATLGGFFALMVLLVLYKSKSKTERALEDPHLAAAAVAEAEEEERQIAAALEATAYEQLNPSRKARRSLDTSSVSPRWIRNTKRFSSIAGYSTLMDPPLRLSSKLPCSIDEDSPTDEAHMLYDDVYACYESHLGIPTRRASNITCSSSGSSYLERRGSSVMLGLPTIPAHKHYHHQQQTRRRQSSPLPEYDFYYPIDIRVIQPTPGGSPCGSERALYDVVPTKQHLTPRLAPLASISSCNSSLANDYPDLDMHSHVSYVSDSVFHDIEYYEDTDDEVDPFSTDSEGEERDCCREECEEDQEEIRPCCSKECHIRLTKTKPSSTLSTISDESTSTLIGAEGRIEEEDEEEYIEEPTTSRTHRKCVGDMSMLGTLGCTLETLERKRGSCCSMEGTPSPTLTRRSLSDHASGEPTSIAIIGTQTRSGEANSTSETGNIELIDIDIGEQNVWSKETLF